MNLLKYASFSLLIGIPAGIILSFILTPLLFKLEPILNIEIAGHSGPSGFVFVVVIGLISLISFLIFWRKSK